MESFDRILKAACRALGAVAGSSLVLLMTLTVVDVVLRGFRRPVPGTYELVAFAGSLVIGLALPLTQRARGHIYVEVLVEKLPRKARDGFHLVTRFLVIGLFAVIGWNLVKYGLGLIRTGEVSLTLQMPFWPFAFAVALSCFVQCLVCAGEVMRILGGRYE
jgi:TRAP-type C4-dicarboxylate transport system permease small subunit